MFFKMDCVDKNLHILFLDTDQSDSETDSNDEDSSTDEETISSVSPEAQSEEPTEYQVTTY